MRIALLLLLVLWGCSSTDPLLIGATPANAPKVGKFCAHYIGFTLLQASSFRVAGNEDTYSAAKQGDIRNISIVDRESTNYLLYKKVCTVVHGS